VSKAVLVDVTKCVGCGGCTVACKMWNDLEFDKSMPSHSENPKLTSKNWTTVTYQKVNKGGKQVWRFVKEQCLHCEDPACASVCFSKAIKKTPQGPVVYYPNLCVGCRYCMVACPFDIPKYQWEKVLPSITKCQMCVTKIKKGEAPACTSVCPTNALTFGDRDKLLAFAKKKIENGDKYIKHIYGEKEAGGTNWFYISDVSFKELGFPTNIPKEPLPHYTHEYLKLTPTVFIGGGALFTALSIYTRRRNEIAKEKEGK